MSPRLADPALRVSSISKSYGPVTAVDDVSMSLSGGEILALLGPNGAGKTTTIACAVGLERPDRGEVRIFGHDPVREGELTRGMVGVMLQDGGLPLGSRPLEALHHLARFYREPLDVASLAERLGITSFSSRTIRRLSGGERQRVALASALVGRPSVIFLDEPTAGLDPQAQLVVWEVVEELRRDGVAIVLSTHTIDDAERLAARVGILDHGRVIAMGTPAELRGRDADGSGPQTLTVRLSSPASATLTASVREMAARAGCRGEVADEALTITGRVSVALMHALTGALLDEGQEADALSLEQRTLADVFFDLTGRSLR